MKRNPLIWLALVLVLVLTLPAEAQAATSEGFCSITFDADGLDGTGAMSAVVGELFTIPSTRIVREGYAFLGWARTRGAQIPDYEPGDSFTPTGDITLYAVWAGNGVAITKVRLNKSSHSIKHHSQYQLRATVSPATATSAALVWSSSNERVATVSRDGLVSALSPGKATITAIASNRKYAKCRITVKALKVSRVRIAESETTIYIGANMTLSASVLPANATNTALKWKSSNAKIASVSSSGIVTAKKKGTVTITAAAKDGSKKKASRKIKVVPVPLNALSNPASSALYATTLNQLKAQLGVANLADQTSIGSYGWCKTTGIVSAICADLDADQIDEMIVVYLKRESPGGDTRYALYMDVYAYRSGVTKTASLMLSSGFTMIYYALDLYVLDKGGVRYLYLEDVCGYEGNAGRYYVFRLRDGSLGMPIALINPGFSERTYFGRMPAYASVSSTDSLYDDFSNGNSTKMYAVSVRGKKSGKYGSIAAALKGQLSKYGLSFEKKKAGYYSGYKAKNKTYMTRIFGVYALMDNYDDNGDATGIGRITDGTNLRG